MNADGDEWGEQVGEAISLILHDLSNALSPECLTRHHLSNGTRKRPCCVPTRSPCAGHQLSLLLKV